MCGTRLCQVPHPSVNHLFFVDDMNGSRHLDKIPNCPEKSFEYRENLKKTRKSMKSFSVTMIPTGQ